MPLDQDMAELLERIARANAPEYPEMGAILSREFVDRNLPVIDVPPVAVYEIQDVLVDGWQGAKNAARLYLPRAANWHEPLPVLLWLHGGGFTIGSITSYDAVCRTLCAQSGVAVLSVAYRLAPEAKFPTAAMDALAAYQWLLREAASHGLDPQKIMIGGDSAGGTLSAATCLQLRDLGLPQPILQMLIYPGTCGFGETLAYTKFAQGYRLTRPIIDWFFAQYLNNDEERNDIRFAPLYAKSHVGLAPAWVAIAQYDPLADDGHLYAEKLRQSDVYAELIQYDGVIHGFLNFGGLIQRSRILHQDMVDKIKSVVARTIETR